MKRLALVAVAVLAVAACGKKDENAADTTAMRDDQPRRPTMTDTSKKMTDTSMKMDTSKKMMDTTMKKDSTTTTTKKP